MQLSKPRSSQALVPGTAGTAIAAAEALSLGATRTAIAASRSLRFGLGHDAGDRGTP